MQTTEITCPSGLSGVIRKIRVSDLDVFADRKLIKRHGAAIDAELARRVWVRTTDTGPAYAFDDTPPWGSDILMGDRFYAIMQARILTRGSDYEFEVQCTSDMCRARFNWGLDLNDLPVVSLPETSFEPFRNANRFTSQLPSNGDSVLWSLPTGRVQKRMDKYIRQHGRGLTALYAARMCGIVGHENDNIDFVEYVGDLDIEDFDALVFAMEGADCGVDTAIEIECPHCFTVQEMDVGFGKDFFTRDFSRARSASRRAARKSLSESST